MPLTPSGQALWKRGRLQVVSVALSSGVRIRIYNHYGPSLPEHSTERDSYYQELLQEVTVSHEAGIIGGDWNMDPRQLGAVATLQSLGWIAPEWTCPKGQGCSATYELAGASSLLGWVPLKPQIAGGGI